MNNQVIEVDGRKFELVLVGALGKGIKDFEGEQVYALRPIEEPINKKAEIGWEVTWEATPRDAKFYIQTNDGLSPEQAEAIKESIEVLMGCITSDHPLTDKYLINRVHEARQLIHGGEDE